MPLRKLDKYVSSFVDRHGKERFRFRRDGVSRYLPPPGAKEYPLAYNEALNGVPGLERAKEGSVGHMVARFYQSIQFRRPSLGWQRTMRQFIEPFREEFGKDMVTNFRTSHINAILAAKMTQTIVNGKRAGGTAAAERLREVLFRLFDFARKEGLVETNPVDDAERIGHQGAGYHTWTEAEIAQYRARWPLGTQARLAMELMLWTGMRRANAAKVTPPVNGRLKAVAVKTGKAIDMLVMPQLQAAIEAMGPINTPTLLATSAGKAFTDAGMGNKMREWCDAAGLPQCSAHGLRKAMATRGANAGVGQQGLKSLGQWAGDDEVRTYTETADRHRLAEAALVRISEWEQSEAID